jgi:hypothetical protein
VVGHVENQEHPGGAEAILKYAGTDATSAFVPIHSPSALEEHLPAPRHLGLLTKASVSALNQLKVKQKTKDELRIELARKRMLPLSRILNLEDMEVRHCIFYYHLCLERM